MSENKPREFWINEVLGTASGTEESIVNGYYTHVIKYEAYEAALDIINKMQAALESIAAVHLIGKQICEPDEAIHVLNTDTEIARSTLAETSKLLEGLKR